VGAPCSFAFLTEVGAALEKGNVYQIQRPHQWEFIRRQLNRLLNDRYVASLSRWCDASQRIVRVLREVRGNVGRDLDFALDSHRVGHH